MTDNVVQLTGQRKPVIPEFITMADIDSMSDDECDAMIAAIRTRRMNSYALYKRMKDDKAVISAAKHKVQIDKKLEQIFKLIEKSNDVIDKLETRISELRGLRLQAGLDLI